MMKKFVAILMIACLVLTMLPLQAFAATPTHVEVTKSNAAIRSGKGEKYSIVARASKGTVFEVVDSGLNIYLNRWYKIRLNSTDGVKTAWIFEDNVKKVSASGYTTAIKLSKTDVSLNLRGTKTATLSGICKYKNRTESNSQLIWSSSNPAIASVDSNGKVTAKAVGVATITVKHKLFSTTATATVKVTEQVTLGVKAKEQSNSSCCSGASAAAVLRYLKGSSFTKTDLALYKEMGSEGNVGKVVRLLNKYLGKTVYRYTTRNSQSKYIDAIKSSVNAGYPAIALVKVTSKTYTKYTSSGHFFVVDGYRINTDGSVDVRIVDSWKTSQNSGRYWIPAKTLFSFSSAHRHPYYLIVK